MPSSFRIHGFGSEDQALDVFGAVGPIIWSVWQVELARSFIWGSPKLGVPFWELPIRRTIVYWGLQWDPPGKLA